MAPLWHHLGFLGHQFGAKGRKESPQGSLIMLCLWLPLDSSWVLGRNTVTGLGVVHGAQVENTQVAEK